MTKFYVFIALLLLIMLLPVLWLATKPKTGPPVAEPVENDAVWFTVDVKSEPTHVVAGHPVSLIFEIKDSSGRVVPDFEIVHEKPMHLVVVRDDLAIFQHIHPQRTPSGEYSVVTSFPSAGAYRLYLDYTPKDAPAQLARKEIEVAGPSHKRVQLVADKKYTRRTGDLLVTMRPSKPLKAGEAITLTFDVAEAQTGKPVKDLQPYLGAMGHFVAISEDTTEYLHAHPLDKNGSPMPMAGSGVANSGQPVVSGGPEVMTRTIFPKPGLYKLWAQFQRAGHVITAAYVVGVGEGEVEDAVEPSTTEDGMQQIKITVGEKGYEPSSVRLRRGIPARLLFYREDDNNCAGQMIIRNLDIRKKLPVGKLVAVQFTPEREGKYTFTCGMNMLRGTLVVTQ